MVWKWQLHRVDIVFEGIKCYVPQKIVGKNPDSEYYNKEVKVKVKVRKMYNMRKFGQSYQADLKRLSKELLIAKKVQEKYLRSVL